MSVHLKELFYPKDEVPGCFWQQLTWISGCWKALLSFHFCSC